MKFVNTKKREVSSRKSCIRALCKENRIILETEDLMNQISRDRMKLMHLKSSIFPSEHLFLKNEMIVNHFCNVAVKKNRRDAGEVYGPISATD